MDIDVILNYLPLIFGIALILIVGISIVVALVRGLFKARVRVGGIVICFLLAFLITGILKTTMVSFSESVEQTARAMLANEAVNRIFDLFKQSQQLKESFVGATGALAAPLLFLIVFLVLQFFTWVIHLIVTLILRKKIKALDEKSSLTRLRACLLGAVQGLLIFFVLMVPVYAYGTLAGTVAESAGAQTETTEMAEAEALGYAETYAMPQTLSLQPLAQTTGNQGGFLFRLYGTLGGNAACNSLTEFRVNGEKTTLVQEASAIGSFAGKIIGLSNSGGIENFGERQGEILKELNEPYRRSKLLQVAAGELVYAVADGWLNGGEALGMEKPDVGEAMAPVLDAFLEALRQDARDPGRLGDDFITVGNVISILAKEGVMQELGEGGDSEKLMQALAQSTAVRDIAAELDGNESMKALVPEMTGIGMRAVSAAILSLPENAEEIFEQFLDEIVETVNEVLISNATHERRVTALTGRFMQALENSGVDFEIDPSVAELYADVILTDIETRGLTEVTREDIEELFHIYTVTGESDK